MKTKRSIYCIEDSQIIVSDMMTGKMEGIPSISTSCLMNPRCLARMEKAYEEDDAKCICWECFAAQGISYKKGLRENLEQNFELLNSRVLSTDELLQFRKMVEIARIESWGDVASVTQALNYINLMNLNPQVTFGMWTKNPDLWDEAIKANGKPDNMIALYSSPIINRVTDVREKYPWFDKIFTVYTKEFVAEHPEIVINCGTKVCDHCRLCYSKNDTIFINELRKADQKKGERN